MAARFLPAHAREESQLRFAVPACIALQGGERASTVAIIRDPQHGTSHPGPLQLPVCDRFVPALCKRRADPGHVWPAHPAVWPRNQPARLPGSPYPSSAITHGKRRSCGTLLQYQESRDGSTLPPPWEDKSRKSPLLATSSRPSVPPSAKSSQKALSSRRNRLYSKCPSPGFLFFPWHLPLVFTVG